MDNLQLGRATQIGSSSVIQSRRLVTGVRARGRSRTRIVARSVALCSCSSISDDTLVARRVTAVQSRLQLDREVWVFLFCYIDVECAVKLGRNVGVGGGTYMSTHGYWLSLLDGFPSGRGPISIDDDTRIPWSCFAMPGMTIGNRVVVGARFLVSSPVPENALVARATPKVVREQSFRQVTDEQRWSLLAQLAHDYAAERGTSCSEVAGRYGARQLKFGDVFVLQVWPRGTTAAAAQAADAGLRRLLHVPLDPVSEDLQRRIPILSVANYQSSSAELMGTQALQ